MPLSPSWLVSRTMQLSFPILLRCVLYVSSGSGYIKSWQEVFLPLPKTLILHFCPHLQGIKSQWRHPHARSHVCSTQQGLLSELAATAPDFCRISTGAGFPPNYRDSPAYEREILCDLFPAVTDVLCLVSSISLREFKRNARVEVIKTKIMGA